MEKPEQLFKLGTGLILKVGDKVEIKTDGEEFDELLIEVIEEINEDGIWIEGNFEIPFSYIDSIKMIEEAESEYLE